jgi:DNA-nicking Smr family endonuclease
MSKIDLHGVKHDDVQRKLDIFFWEMIQRKKSQVEVITGISTRMKEIVKLTCQDYGFKVIELNFNPGVLIIEL